MNSEIFQAFQNKLKIGNRRGVHLNAIPGNSRYKLDLARFSSIFKSLPERFILDLLTLRNVNFSFSIHDNPSTAEENSKHTALNQYLKNANNAEKTEKNSQREEELSKLVSSIENLIFQNEVVFSEKGINTLGFGFPILIRKDMNDGQISASPILIWSIKIKPSTQMNTWEISRTEDDPIYLNEVLINHLQTDSGVILNPIPDEMLEDGKIDKPELFSICNDILKQLKVSQNIDFLLNNYTEILPLKSKATYDTLLSQKGDALIEKCGIFSLFEVQKQNIINDYDTLKKSFVPFEEISKNADFQTITSIETDPSQQEILESLKNQSKILIQGPPGTGKSQTLTAILINALENKQRTIVVCEKQTALEVLYNSLQNKGLGKYCTMIKDSVSDRKMVVDAVRSLIDDVEFKRQSETSQKDILQEQIDDIQKIKSNINQIHNKLNTPVINGKSWTEIVGKILEYQSEREDVNLHSFSFKFDSKEFAEISEVLTQGKHLYAKFKPFKEHYFYNPSKINYKNHFTVHQEISDSFQDYILSWKKIEKLVKDYKLFYYSKRKEEFASQLEKLYSHINEYEIITSTLPENSDIFDIKKTDNFFYKISALFSTSKSKNIKLQKRLQEIGQLVKAISVHTNFLPIEISADLWKNKAEIQSYRSKIDISKADFAQKIETDFKQLDLLNFFDQKFKDTNLESIVYQVNELKTKINNDAWLSKTDFGYSFQQFAEQIQTIFKRYENYQNHPDNPFMIEYEWFAFYNKLSDFQKKCILALENNDNWEPSFLHTYYTLLLRETADDSLNFDERNYVDFNRKIQLFSTSQKDFIENFWSVTQKNAVKNFEQKNTDLTVANLYNKRRSEKHNRLTLRQIVMKDYDLFTAFFPIVLTTPDVCCNLFQGKNFYFDNVVFDEASQLKLEDNFPAMLKGKTVIVAGDEHQMPPSNYFSRVFDGSFEDEDDIEDENSVISYKNAILNIESLLDYALEYQFDKNHLDFHYRSKHPFLIEFSNHAFYNSRLRPLPNTNLEKPIEFIEVNGTFNEHINEDEAEKVLEILEKIEPKADGSFPSVGIATFNITQRNFIRRKILQKQSLDSTNSFQQKIVALEQAGLFIKNLENIQGDERDIIIISTTYGRKKGGKFTQSFGPINHSKGYKLLNVIITRAKEKIYVCNSIPEEFYNNYKEALAQEGANNRKAVLYAYLAYCKAVSDENETARKEILNQLDVYGFKHNGEKKQIDNNFKIETFNLLTAKYPNKKIALDYPFGGYTIDILIEPNVGKPIALECLSKPIYQGDLAYMEDLHKEKILRNLGFEYKRIWANNYLNNNIL